MDTKLWNELRADPANSKTSVQLAAEQREREHQRALSSIKRPVTAEQRKAAAKKYRQIQAQNELEKQLEQDSIVAQRTKELEALVTSALETATPSEASRVRLAVTPAMLKHWALYCDDYNVVEYLNAELQKVRAAKVLGL